MINEIQTDIHGKSLKRENIWSHLITAVCIENEIKSSLQFFNSPIASLLSFCLKIERNTFQLSSGQLDLLDFVGTRLSTIFEGQVVMIGVLMP